MLYFGGNYLLNAREGGHLGKQYLLMDRYLNSSVCLFQCYLERQGWIDAIREGGGKDFDETMKEERGGVVVWYL